MIQVEQDKAITLDQTDSLNSTASTLGLMNQGKFAGWPINLITSMEAIEKHLGNLVVSRAACEKRVAPFMIMAQQGAQNLMIEATITPITEATAMLMDKAIKIMNIATKRIGRIVE